MIGSYDFIWFVCEKNRRFTSSAHYGLDSCRRTRRIKKFNITRFNAREAAYAFLREYDCESFVKAQKVMK